MDRKIHACNSVNGQEVESFWMEKIKAITKKSQCQRITVALRPGMNERWKQCYVILVKIEAGNGQDQRKKNDADALRFKV